MLLTKPLGTGYITTAAKAGHCPAETLELAVESMCQLNRGGSQAARIAGAHAMTDVTGFGLAGHAAEMALASNVTMILQTDAVPAFPGAIELGRQGYRTRANRSNRAFVEPQMRIDGSPDADRLELCFDAQTSGGLLICTPKGSEDRLATHLESLGEARPVRVGEIQEREAVALVLR